MKKIDKMTRDALLIKDALQPTIYLIMNDMSLCETELHLETVYGVEVIRKSHPNKEAAERYIEEMKKVYRVALNLKEIHDDYLVGYVPTIIDDIPKGEYNGEEET